MQPAGAETLALWREAGEWWNNTPPREVHQFIDAKGVRREVISNIKPPDESDPSGIRIRRVKDEKVSLALGNFAPPQFSRSGRPPRLDPNMLLHAQSAYALSCGTVLAGELAAYAADKQYGAALIADPFSLVGAREFVKTANKIGVKPLIGATFEMADGGELVLVAKNKIGYRSLSRLITECHLDEPRLYPLCTWERLERHNEGLLCLSGGALGPLDLRLIKRDFNGAEQVLDRLIGLYGKADVFIQIERSYLPWQITVEYYLRQLAKSKGIHSIAGGPTLYAEPEHFPAHDVLVCVDSLCLIEEIEGRKPTRDPAQPQITHTPRRSLNAERYMRSAKDLRCLFDDSPDLILNYKRVIERCEEDILPGRINLPRFCQDEDAQLHLIVRSGLYSDFSKFKGQRKVELNKRIEIELKRTVELGWSRHFLIAWEMCEWARGQDILLSGRGSVVDSVIAYCLGISRINAFEFDLHYNRFFSFSGESRPDIDVDFEAARREDVRQHLVQTYGDAHVATVAAIGTYSTRGILREVGKVMGIPEEHMSFLSKRLHGSVSPQRLEEALSTKPELRDSNIPPERYHWVFKLAERLDDLPRNLRAHSSGVVISEQPIADIVPVQQSGADGVKIIQWDKRSAKYCFDKFDVLCLRGNDVLGGTERKAGGELKVTNLPLDDPEVYRAMRAGQLIGIPQSASPAMRQAHIRIGTTNLKEAGIVQAAIRPGVGGAVKLNEYIARRKGKHFRNVHPDVDWILNPTLGVVIFQEQIDQLLLQFGGYNGDQAEEIRESIQKHYSRGRDGEPNNEIIAQIVSRGYTHHVAQEVYNLVSGFKGFGFAEGHALSFAEVSIRSIYCQQNYPVPFFAALLDAQPAGYYGPATIANEARARGVKMLPPDYNKSEEKFSVADVFSKEPPRIGVPDAGIRVPLSQISGLSKITLEKAVKNKPYASFFDFVTRVVPKRDELEFLILAGAFDSYHHNRRCLLWAVTQAINHGSAMRQMEGCLPFMIADPPLPSGIVDFNQGEKAIQERRLMGLDIERHLVAFERDRVKAKGGLTTAEASCLKSSDTVFVVGNPIRLRFPPTSSGKRVMFFDLEDETGLLNVTCFDDVYQRDGHKVICNPYITLWGEAQNRDGHIAFMAKRIVPYKPTMEGVTDPGLLPIVTGDFLMK